MVADRYMEKDKKMIPPTFDQKDVVTWVKKINMWLMKKRRYHLGMEPKPKKAPIHANSAARGKYRAVLEQWMERKDTYESLILFMMVKNQSGGEVHYQVYDRKAV